MDKSICFLSPQNILYSKGGVETQIYYLAKEFIHRGWSVEIVLPDKGNFSDSSYIIDGVRYHKYKYGNVVTQLVSILLILCFRTKSQYFYTRGISTPLQSSLYLYSKIFRKKYIWALCVLEESQDLSFGAKKNYEKTIKSIVYSFLNRLFLNFKRKADYIFCQTDEQSKNIEENFNLSSNVVRNSHPVKILSSKKARKYIFWSRPLVPEKKPEVFFRLVNDLNERIEKQDLQFLIISRLANHTTEHLKKMLQSVSTQKNVTYLEEVSQDQMNDFFAQSYFYVNTSNYEGFPNNMIQAWLHGALVISLKLDPDNLLSHEKMGVVVQNYQELKEAVEHYMKHKEERLEITSTARQKAVKMFDLSKNVEKIENILLNK